MRASFRSVIALCAFFLLAAVRSDAQNITLTVTGLRSAKGQVVVAVFKTAEAFKDSKPSQRFLFSKKSVTNGTLRASCSLPAGTYGVAFVDDENGNGTMDDNFMGLPKEGFGFSNYYTSGMSRPAFSKFSFEVADRPVQLTLKTRYL